MKKYVLKIDDHIKPITGWISGLIHSNSAPSC